MASSKKYGYQLRGEKLSLCELDITGSGSGLNYSYEENAGLDISTDPSAWKSPLTTIADGLQIEYLSNEFLLFNPNDAFGQVSEAISLGFSQMDDISYIHNSQQDVLDTFSQVFTNPLLHSQSSLITQLNGNIGNALKVSRLASSTSSLNSIDGGDAYLNLNSFNLSQGARYKFSMNVKFNCNPNSFDNRPEDFGYTFQLLLGDGASPQQDINNPSVGPIDFGGIGGTYNNINEFGIVYNTNGTLGSDWMTCSFDFIAPQDNVILLFIFPEMAGTEGTDDRYLYIDNLKLTQVELAQSESTESEIQLPSYAQKALLDYVRAQDSYENGDLEKWDFFMKQFRSKLERWEDSRITGPRVLGPHGPSSIT